MKPETKKRVFLLVVAVLLIYLVFRALKPKAKPQPKADWLDLFSTPQKQPIGLLELHRGQTK